MSIVVEEPAQITPVLRSAGRKAVIGPSGAEFDWKIIRIR